MKLLVAGTRGQAKDLIEGLFLDNLVSEVTFFDDVSSESTIDNLIKGFPVINNIHDAKKYFNTVSSNFIVAVGSPLKRKLITEKLNKIGGTNISFLSPNALIHDTKEISNEGVIIQVDSIISSEVKIQKGVLINVKCIVLSNVEIGEYTSLAPQVFVQNDVKIGKNCIISTGVRIAPNVRIGDNVKIWMNKFVDSDIPSNTNLI